MSKPQYKWKLTLEWTTCEPGSVPGETVISQTGQWDDSDGQRPPAECLALDLGYLCRALIGSGRVIPFDPQDVCEAFSSIWD